MKSLNELYKIGKGPSSSHTIGPQIIAEYAIKNFGKIKYRVVLFGSLALTGKGHGTDRVLKETLGNETEIVFNTENRNLPHPNFLKIYGKTEKFGNLNGHGESDEYVFGGFKLLVTALSVGGGSVIINGKPYPSGADVYSQNNFDEIKRYIKANELTVPEYVRTFDKSAYDNLPHIWQQMKESVERGLNAEGILPGGIGLERKAKALYSESAKFEPVIMSGNRKISAYALAVAEENADNKTVVTAPTCGSCGIVPAVLYYMNKDLNVPDEDIANALAVAGVIGNVVKENASISGAECGCQAEVGVACSMAAAALAYLYGLNVDTIECSAEIALEHNLGLTCDPVLGLVQIPCIERNAMAAVEAVNAVTLAKSLENKRKIAFDDIVKVMYETGKDLKSGYRETSSGGLAKIYKAK